MSSLKDLVPTIDIGLKGRAITIELFCADAYAARVIFDDIVQKAESESGLLLKLRGSRKPAGGGA